MRFDLLAQCVLPVLEHLDQNLQLLVQLRDRAFFFRL